MNDTPSIAAGALYRKVGAVIVEKDVLVCASRPVSKIAPECLGCFLLKVDGALLVALAVDKHDALVQVNVVEGQPDKL